MEPRLTKPIIMIIALMVLAGCSTAPSGHFCLMAAPIRPSVLDEMTDGTKRQILSHNTLGRELCRWQP